ncbi:hypothetical protein EMPG_15894 [Blastomyces silverae]|uniref:Uncharacterized protein n=1 Tax=Blastomyces silverae TaxID=2060906 RepID=A0A0H1BBD5_9EURO|nr:hypothetical protein EMPG_15894 [Blastomyces silverae]
MSAFEYASSESSSDDSRNERVLQWLNSQGDPDFENDNHTRTGAEIVIQIKGTDGQADEYVHLRPPRSNLDVDFESSTGTVTIRETTTVPAAEIIGGEAELQGEAEEGLYTSTAGSRPEATNLPHLSVLVRLNRGICELVALEELNDNSLLLSIDIMGGHRLSTENHQYGFISGRVVSILENALRQPRQIRAMQILLPASQIPWRWTAATVLVTFGKISARERRNMGLIYQRVRECQYQIQEYDKVVPKEKMLGELVEQEGVAVRNLETLDVEERREWLGRYERIVDEQAVVKTRDQWVLEGERLKEEHNALQDIIGGFTRVADGSEEFARRNQEI